MNSTANTTRIALAVGLGALSALLGVVLIVWIWFERGEFYGVGIVPIIIGLLAISTARRGVSDR